MNPRVIGIAGPFKGTIFPLPDGGVSIGRDPSNQLCIADSALSRRHSVITHEAQQFKICDLGSRNGTRVNGIRVSEVELHHRDHILIGNSVLIFLLEENELNFENNPIELTQTGELGPAVLLREEDALYLRPDRVMAALPQTDRMARDLNSLLRIATGIGGIRERESLAWQLLGMVFDIAPADRGAVLYLSEDAKECNSAVAWDRLRGPGYPVRLSETVVRRAMRDRIGLLVTDVAADKTLRDNGTLAQLGIHSLLCVPLVVLGNVMGVIYLDSLTPTERLDENDLQVLTAVASLTSLALDNVRRWEGLEEENRQLRAEINLEHDMVGKSARMREVYELIRRVAFTDSTVLIQGESGTGKELVARAIHRNSSRSECPFVAINCATLTETLLESELFGHEKGAFTGAFAQKKGKIELAQGGTLFLDEVSELAVGPQAKLLRVLQEREFERVGGTRSIQANVRLIAATNKTLSEAVTAGSFRSDLYYRLNVIALTMPTLRERREDIPALAEHFIVKTSRTCGMRVKALSPEALSCLTSYDWPGNVRELENTIERAMVLGTAEVILAEDLPEVVVEAAPLAVTPAAKYHGAVKDSKKQLIVQALQQANGNYIEAAKLLGLHPNSLLRLIRNLGLRAPKATNAPTVTR